MAKPRKSETVSPLKYAEAEKVGKALAIRFTAITGKKPPILGQEAWADLVQFVVRRAVDEVAAREGEGL